MNKTLLSISAFDSSGATGLAADLKSFQSFRVYGTGAVTAVIARNTVSAQALHPVPMEVVGQQIEAVASDMPIHGVKVGILATAANAQMVATLLPALQLCGGLVVDPVLRSPMGETLLEPSAIPILKEKVIPIAFAVTPNRYEAEVLSGISVPDIPAAKEAAKIIHGMGCQHVVVTGGGLEGSRAQEVWFDGTHYHLFDAVKLPTKNTLGIGCTFSAILAALIAKGMVMGEAIDRAKRYIAKAIQHPFQIGQGLGPLNHTVPI